MIVRHLSAFRMSLSGITVNPYCSSQSKLSLWVALRLVRLPPHCGGNLTNGAVGHTAPFVDRTTAPFVDRTTAPFVDRTCAGGRISGS